MQQTLLEHIANEVAELSKLCIIRGHGPWNDINENLTDRCYVMDRLIDWVIDSTSGSKEIKTRFFRNNPIRAHIQGHDRWQG